MKRAAPYDREAALDAAVTLFWTKGYFATSLKDIEGALNMKPGSIYAAFSSKEALFRAALERYFQTSKTTLKTAFERADSPLKGLANYLRAIADNETQHPQCHACMLVKTLLGATALEESMADDARNYLDQLMMEIAAAFDRAKAAGELPADADSGRLARRYQSCITAIRIELHRGTNQAELAMLTEDMAQGIEQLSAQAS